MRAITKGDPSGSLTASRALLAGESVDEIAFLLALATPT